MSIVNKDLRFTTASPTYKFSFQKKATTRLHSDRGAIYQHMLFVLVDTVLQVLLQSSHLGVSDLTY